MKVYFCNCQTGSSVTGSGMQYIRHGLPEWGFKFKVFLGAVLERSGVRMTEFEPILSGHICDSIVLT